MVLDREHESFLKKAFEDKDSYKRVFGGERLRLILEDVPCPQCGRKMKPINEGVVCRYCHIAQNIRGDILKAKEKCNCKICTSLRTQIPPSPPPPPQKSEYRVNKYISLKLENRLTTIYVRGRRFTQCIRLILQIPKADVEEYDEIDSIDEAAEHYDTYIHRRGIIRGPNTRRVPNQNYQITAEQEFWGHCSNLQVWADNNYDTRILHRNIAFPLLQQLYHAKDPVARKVFKEEIAVRLESGFPAVVQFLLNQRYLKYLSLNEIKLVIEDTNFLENLFKYNSLKVLSSLHPYLRNIGHVFKKPLLKLLQEENYEQFFPLLKFLTSKGYLKEYGKSFLRELFLTIMKCEHVKPHFLQIIWEVHHYYPEILTNFLAKMMADNEIEIFPKYLEEFVNVISIKEEIISELEVLQYIQSKGCNTSKALLEGKKFKSIITTLLDKAIYRAKANGRNIVRGFDL